jgi:5'-nucleotidase
MRRFIVLFALAALLTVGVAAQDEAFALAIIHTNDTHAGHLPNSAGNGGVARMATVINLIRAEAPNSLLLDTGDRFQGSLFHTQYKGQDQVAIMNLLGYQAMSLGNHEFDNGDAVLAQFIDGVPFPVLAANIDVEQSPELAGKVAPSAVIGVNGQQIGVIGLTTAETPFISSPGENVIFSDDYVGEINSEAAALTEQGVNKIIVIGHLGILDAERVLPQLENVDIFLDGHSHTLFSNTYNGAAGEYPLTFENAAGETIYYGQTGSNSQYVGRMDVTFDAAGVITAASGDTILLNKYIAADPTAEALVADLYEEVQGLTEQLIGATATETLTGDRLVCRAEECALGNLIADAMRAGTGAQIAIMNGGGIRADIEAGDITLGDVLTVQPFGNIMSTFELTGANVILALENGVSGVTAEDGVVNRDGLSGRFPQVSGIRFAFDPTRGPGDRIVSVEVENEDGTFSALDPDTVYSVVTNNFVRTGGDGYSILAEQAIDPYDFGAVDYELTAAYLSGLGEVAPDLDGRITMVNAELSPLE